MATESVSCWDPTAYRGGDFCQSPGCVRCFPPPYTCDQDLIWEGAGHCGRDECARCAVSSSEGATAKRVGAFVREHHRPGQMIMTKQPGVLDQPVRAKTSAPNPKDLIGIDKLPTLSVIPTAAILAESGAMQDGARKYGRFNWREFPVQASIYIDALMRHVLAWTDGEENARDSGHHHLGHARACLGILIDAQECGNLIDDRVQGPAADIIARWTVTHEEV